MEEVIYSQEVTPVNLVQIPYLLVLSAIILEYAKVVNKATFLTVQINANFVPLQLLSQAVFSVIPHRFVNIVPVDTS